MLISITLVLVHDCIQNERQVDKKLANQVLISREMLEGSRRFDEKKDQEMHIGSDTLKYSTRLLVLEGTQHHVIRKIEFE
ncbi:hypothetical protein IV84_GL001672 [Pediococcus damnosus]|nr:hypothetical protein [Pediococcus damnosus]AMV59890.1 Hypothetical protein ADU69_0212 [Pediococcus damnosus]AMV69989.1 Hypothetical protein ADU73_1597 [Pediococcus damnosus]KRN47757.1 hypothetical protein IV84_GL001672 [Pediococcus damnosus]